MVAVGSYNQLIVARITEIGAYLEDGKEGILLPKRFLTPGIRPGDTLTVFVYHDSEDRLIATTQQARACVGEIAKLKAVAITQHGAFLDWGLMKDLFVPRSKQLTGMRVGGEYLVRLYIDEQTGRVAATEKIEQYLTNDPITLKEMDAVRLLIYRKTDIGYLVIINNRHTGVLHFNEIYRTVQIGDSLEGFIKAVKPGNKIDMALGVPGYQRVEGETEKILRLLREHDGYLPYHDKSEPEAIYAFFGMSKKTFKMATGSLYKMRRIDFTGSGIKLVQE